MNASVTMRPIFPSTRVRGKGAERRGREADEGAMPSSRLPLTRLAALADLSPQAGRGAEKKGAR